MVNRILQGNQVDFMDLIVSLAQVNFTLGDIRKNAELIIQWTKRARDEQGAHLVVFPELALVGYPPEDILLRPTLYPLAEQALLHIASQVKGIDVVVGYPLRESGHSYNAAAIIRQGRIIANYKKQELPNYSVFDEKRYFSAGDQPYIIDVQGVRVAITICEDIWFPEPMAQAKSAGAELMVVLNASPFHFDKIQQRRDLLVRRAVEGNMPIAYVQTVGGQDELVFDGGSMVVDSKGTLCGQAPFFSEALYPVKFRRENQLVQPILSTIAEPLSDVQSIYEALVLGVRDYVNKNGFPGVVVGSSGGVDSALALAIAVDALGSERVESVMMPTRFTSKMSVEDAQALADNLGFSHSVVSIDALYQSTLDTLAKPFTGFAPGTTEENIQARLRGMIMMAFSNKKNTLVLTTGNKSELSVGYATLYGDMVGGFCVLKNVPKTWVYLLAHYRNTLSSVIPPRIIDREPSAELAMNQKDSDMLPPYEILDAILLRYIDQDKNVQEIIAEGFESEVVKRIAKMVDRNEYKRHQAAPGVYITDRSFGRDRRYPITSHYGKNEAEFVG